MRVNYLNYHTVELRVKFREINPSQCVCKREHNITFSFDFSVKSIWVELSCVTVFTKNQFDKIFEDHVFIYVHCLNNQTEPNCAKPKPNRFANNGFENTLNYYVHLLLTKYFLAKNQIMCRRQMIFFQSSFFPSDVILSRNPYLSTAQRQKCH